MNVELLEKVKQHILEEPKRLDMSMFAEWLGDTEDAPACKTAACIAGWAIILGEKVSLDEETVNELVRPSTASIESRACRLLDISEEQGILFYSWQWPQPYRMEFNSARTLSKKALAAARRIDHFIRTGQ